MDKPAILLDRVSVKTGNKTIIEDVSISIKEGEFWGIIGPNGGGKTTLLRTIIGVVKPTNGKVEIFGMKPHQAIKKGLVGYLPQQIKGIIPLSALDFVRTAGNPELAEEALEMVGLRDKKELPFEKLSGGEKQRTLIAAVFSRKPKVLLLDEPNTGIDVVAQDSFYNLLRNLKHQGVTIVMVSHDVGVVTQFVDKVACLNKKLKYSGDPRNALDCNLLEELYGSKVEVFVHHPECAGCHISRKS